jgi:hypothetical protein
VTKHGNLLAAHKLIHMLLSSLALLSTVRNFDMLEKILEIAVGTTEPPPLSPLSLSAFILHPLISFTCLFAI